MYLSKHLIDKGLSAAVSNEQCFTYLVKASYCLCTWIYPQAHNYMLLYLSVSLYKSQEINKAAFGWRDSCPRTV